MAEHSKGTPLSKGTRDAICEEARRVWGTRFQRFSAETIFDYEATVGALEAKLAETQANYQTMLDTACREASIRQRAEIELARLRPLAEVVDAYYAAFMASSATDHCDKALKRTADAEWTRLLDLAALRAAKKTPTTKAVEANDE